MDYAHMIIRIFSNTQLNSKQNRNGKHDHVWREGAYQQYNKTMPGVILVFSSMFNIRKECQTKNFWSLLQSLIMYAQYVVIHANRKKCSRQWWLFYLLFHVWCNKSAKDNNVLRAILINDSFIYHYIG